MNATSTQSEIDDKGRLDIKKILVPIDFSDNSILAAEYALSFASIHHAEILFYNSCYTPPVESELVYIQETTQVKANEKKMHQLIQELLSKHGQINPSSVDTMIDVGSAAFSINRICLQEHVDLIIMGTKGATGLKEVFIGSVASDVIRYLPCHVLVVPENWSQKEMGKILYTCDHTTENLDGLSKVISLSIPFKSHVECVTIDNEYTSEMRDYMNEVEVYANRLGVSISRRFMTSENRDIASSIEEYVSDSNPDLLVTVKHSKSWLSALFEKSVSQKLARHTKVPLLVLKPT